MFDVGHTSNGMAFDVRCSSRLRRRFWGLDSVLLAGWNDLDLVAGVRFRVLLGAFLLERLACLLGQVLSRRFVGHGAPWLAQPGSTMADKSPRQHLSKQAGKSLKEKRAEKHAKADASNKIEIVPPGKKH